FLVVGPSSFGGLFRSGKSSGSDRTVCRYRFWLLALPCSSVHRLVANLPDGDCGFWWLAPSSFDELFRSGKSSGSDRTVAATFRVLQFTVWSRTCPMATAVSSGWPRAFSTGSLGQANPQALIGQSPLPSVFFSSPFGREPARWRLRFLVVGPEHFRRAL